MLQKNQTKTKQKPKLTKQKQHLELPILTEEKHCSSAPLPKNIFLDIPS